MKNNGQTSQYRSHGYLFNHKSAFGLDLEDESQYRSHGYLFNPVHDTLTVEVIKSLNTVLTVISLILYNK